MSTTAPSATTPPSTRLNRDSRIVALIVASAFFMNMLDGAIITTSLPQMAASFGVVPLEMSVGVTIYMLTVAAFVPLAGWLADRFGARNIFMLAILVFTLASLACGLAQELWQFVVARAVQGLGGALMTPVGRMVVLRNAQKSELLHATALISWPALFAPVIGPMLGGFITTYASWQWNFYINIPIGLVGLYLTARYIPKQGDESPRRLDLIGFVLSAGGLMCLLYGMESFAYSHGSPAISAALVAGGLLLGIFAVRHLHRAPVPLLDLRAFKVRTFSLCTLWAGSYFRTAINATPFLLPLFYQIGFGLNALQAGLYVLAYFAGNLGMKTVTTPTLKRYGFRTVLAINGVLAGLSIAACAFFTPQTSQVLMLVVLFIAGLTRSMQFTALNTLAFADIHASQRSSASTLSSMLQQVSMVLGVAVAALLLALSQHLHGNPSLQLADFRIAFIAFGALAFVSSLMFLTLPEDAGTEVSGHQPARDGAAASQRT
ncbi:DHA2 family efflux MFS transporter permease subunit [Uliginosibacterium sp. H1]|uniref:DHA2 family efflux MFS transporter permease subunit n=1 Tax=Uliginosibacterium sp. H1 TaxID=3114757 RepID=UPI002E1784E0|nr:DHA2 family efflux MFS transporter permease subunit [Uliginosibacterium sp. H1]